MLLTELFSEHNLQLNRRSMIEGTAVEVAPDFGCSQVEVYLVAGLGYVSRPHQIVASADASSLQHVHVREKAQIVDVAEDGIAVVQVLSNQAVATLQERIEVHEVGAPGSLGRHRERKPAIDRLI